MAWPTTDEPRDVFVTLRLSEREAALVDASAQVNGMSRSAYIRQCVERVHRKEQRDAARLAGKKAKEDGPPSD